jgi:hypothetical protein
MITILEEKISGRFRKWQPSLWVFDQICAYIQGLIADILSASITLPTFFGDCERTIFYSKKSCWWTSQLFQSIKETTILLISWCENKSVLFINYNYQDIFPRDAISIIFSYAIRDQNKKKKIYRQNLAQTR